MRIFSYLNESERFLTPETVRLLTRVFEDKGRQTFLMQTYGERLTVLREKAHRNSAEAASAPAENYLAALDLIREHFDTIRPEPERICELHKMLYEGEGPEYGPAGEFKKKDYLITEQDEHGRDRVRFVPTPARETEKAVSALCRAWEETEGADPYEQLLMIPVFILDFLSIHPFPDGNCAVAFLLQNLLLYRSGIYVGAYISLEDLTEERRESFDEALQYSSIFWHEGTNSCEPYIDFFLNLLIDAGERFSKETESFIAGTGSGQGLFAALRRKLLGR